MDGDFDRVPGLGPVDIDGTGDRIDLREIQRRDIGRGAVGIEVPAAAIHAFEADRRARRDFLDGRDRTIPPEVMMRAVDGVVTVIAHLWRKPARS